MHHRASLIGATFAIESQEGQGTSAICRLVDAPAAIAGAEKPAGS